MGRLFGTDGVRGVFGRDLTTDLARSIGRAAVTVIARDRREPPAFGVRPAPRRPRAPPPAPVTPRPRREPPTFVIGRDTRASGPVLEDALVDGIVAGGGSAVRAGGGPTPGGGAPRAEVG